MAVTAYIRGSLGGQLACFLAYAAKGQVDEVRFSIGGNIQPESRHSFLPELINNCPHIRLNHGNQKADLTSPKVVMDALAQARKTMLLRSIRPSGEKILHKRVGDRQTTADATYAMLEPEYPVVLDSNRGIENAVDDWFRLASASEVCASVSWFALTAAMFNQNMHLHLLEQDGPVPVHPRAKPAIDALVAQMPNVTWKQP